MTEAAAEPKSTFDRNYWTLCSIEMWERLAYFGVRALIAVFIMQADDVGGLHLTAAHKGTIYAWWFIVQSLLPTFTGGYADRYGYKKTMAFAVCMNMLGYVLMAFNRSYEGFFMAVMVLAFGTAFFKPSIQGALAQNLTKKTASLGWGIFYWVVNIGGAVAPFIASWIVDDHSPMAWRNLFLASAAFTSLNLITLLFVKDVPSGASKTESILEVFKRTMRNIVEPRLVTWLLIMSCFWLMMYQLWDLHPNFLTDWTDSSAVAGAAAHLPFVGEGLSAETERGLQIPQEKLLAVNAMLIIVLMIPVSWVVRKMRTLSAMAIGMLVATAGLLIAGLTNSGWIFLTGVLFFSLGEMLTGPKKQEYLGLIAPAGKKGLYLGYVNIPVGIGGYIGSKMAGYLYGHYGDKAVVAQKYLAEHVIEGGSWDGKLESLDAAAGVDRTAAFAQLQEVTGLDAIAATQLLWDTYSPQYAVWIPFACIGVFATIALVVFGQMAKRWKDMDA
jgi:proton-dependent oligopeptide transporter, POT family